MQAITSRAGLTASGRLSHSSNRPRSLLVDRHTAAVGFARHPAGLVAKVAKGAGPRRGAQSIRAAAGNGAAGPQPGDPLDAASLAGIAAGPPSELRPRGTVALKEWMVTCAALAAGDQTVLFRKGGIKEPTFQPQALEFILFPTSYHAKASLLQDAVADKYAEDLSYDPGRVIGITHAAQITGSWTTSDPRALEILSDFHVYSEEFMEVRLKYKPDSSITLLELQVFEFEEPMNIMNRDEYSGCFSWVQVPIPLRWDGVKPVVPDSEFAAKQNAMREAVAQLEAEELVLPADLGM